MLNEVALGLGVFIAGVVAAVLAWPWLAQAGDRPSRRQGGATLADRREAVLTALRDLDFDHSLAKVPDEDYASQRQVLLLEAAALLTQEDEEPAVRACPLCGRTAGVDAPFCAACGADLSQALPTCPACGREAEPEDVYCRGCGSLLEALA